ncbi:CBL-interacting serine/threonine-protein kinase 14-like [Silene latifolia]|uniref:CBL-interacting serine/threonine-protein kinase 14-like n=1 Tax=Silene latifolia TaxID=37657 RepID=UPI003D77D17C
MLDKHISGKYKLVKLLNNGAYAKVYHAKDTVTGNGVAIKALHGCATKNVEQEIQALTRLDDHPHIIKLVEVFLAGNKQSQHKNDDQVYIVTEYAKRGDLFEMIVKNGGRFTEDISRHYFRQLISAVKHCHSRGVFHRDIKPENILVDDQWRAKLSDFGLCGVWEGKGVARFWEPCGTVEYAAPEVAMAAGECGYDGEKADVWSCGVVLDT